MAAGLGTRLKPFTNRIPKPCLPVLGVPIAQFALDALREAQVESVTANIHWLPSEARRRLQELELQGLHLSFSDESAKLLGSAGGIRKALSHFEEEPFFTLNGDVIAEIDLKVLAQAHFKQRKQHGVLMTLAVHLGVPRGVYTELSWDPATFLLQGLGPKAAQRPFFSGTAIFEPEAFEALPLDQPLELVAEVILPAIRSRRAAAYLVQGAWYDIGFSDLWLQTHLEWIEQLEQNTLPKAWANRVRSVSERISPGLWCSRENAAFLNKKIISEWVGPAYWGAGSTPSPQAPGRLGPQAVLYGSRLEACRGVGWDELWVSAVSGEKV